MQSKESELRQELAALRARVAQLEAQAPDPSGKRLIRHPEQPHLPCQVRSQAERSPCQWRGDRGGRGGRGGLVAMVVVVIVGLAACARLRFLFRPRKKSMFTRRRPHSSSRQTTVRLSAAMSKR